MCFRKDETNDLDCCFEKGKKNKNGCACFAELQDVLLVWACTLPFKMKNINQNLHEFAKNLRSDHNPWMFVDRFRDAF